MKQILIVEDDELLNKMLVYNLQSESYGIVSVETVKEAMEVLKSQPFDLVLLDIKSSGWRWICDCKNNPGKI